MYRGNISNHLLLTERLETFPISEAFCTYKVRSVLYISPFNPDHFIIFYIIWPWQRHHLLAATALTVMPLSILAWRTSLSLPFGTTNPQADSKNLAHWQEVENSYIAHLAPSSHSSSSTSKSSETSSTSTSSDAGSTFSSINSDFRTTWELLRGLPSRTTAARVRTTLPTHIFSIAELCAQLPDRMEAPLVSTYGCRIWQLEINF